ncbi:hypothetical protein MMYC01_201540 [Madurella mycetomatis]|uniref:Uncharacterized protein n=1 Tax=Madurella mycetomatis TaxID=100816 RepID=A0A175WG94_9PEZI|nr:hypothetical protein MMYC01_201540 [Madurella mycetomatis]
MSKILHTIIHTILLKLHNHLHGINPLLTPFECLVDTLQPLPGHQRRTALLDVPIPTLGLPYPSLIPPATPLSQILAVHDVAASVWRDFVAPALRTGKLRCLPPGLGGREGADCRFEGEEDGVRGESTSVGGEDRVQGTGAVLVQAADKVDRMPGGYVNLSDGGFGLISGALNYPMIRSPTLKRPSAPIPTS